MSTSSPSSPSKKRQQPTIGAPTQPPAIAPAPPASLSAQPIAPAPPTAIMAGTVSAMPAPISTEAAKLMGPPTPKSPASPATTRKRKAAEMSAANPAGPSTTKLEQPEDQTMVGQDSIVSQLTEAAATTQPSSANPTPAKKSRTNTPWTPAEERKLKTLRDAGSSWGEIAKEFPNRTEGSVKKHWYKDMHYADFAEDESAALLAAIREYEANKWKEIGKKVGKPAKACEQYAKENFQGKL